MDGGHADLDRAVSQCHGFYAVVCCIRHGGEAEIHHARLYARQ
jgi:hypothetical protein